MLCDCQNVTQAFELATFRMRGLLREDKPETSWNAAADDEFQTLESLSGVIYKTDVDDISLHSEQTCPASGGAGPKDASDLENPKINTIFSFLT